MEHFYNIINEDEYELYDEVQRGIFEYKAKNPHNTLIRANHNYFFAKRALWSDDLHFGEYIGGIIGKKLNFKVCDTALYRNKSNYNDRGVISYVHLSENDKLITPRAIITRYYEYQNLDCKDIYFADIDTIMKAIFWFMYQYKRPYDEFLSFKQDFVDMAIFDLKLLNPDRSQLNWFVRQDVQTKAIDLYPMFDNEMILGFNNDSIDHKYTDEEIKIENTKNMSSILTPDSMYGHKNRSDYKDLFCYLLKKYPIQTNNSIKKFQDFSDNDLLELMNEINDLSDNRIDSAVRLYNERSLNLDKIYSKNIKENEHNQNK